MKTLPPFFLTRRLHALLVKVVLLCLAGMHCLQASAGIMVERTRLIFEEGQQERSLTLANTNDYPIIVQTWVDNGEGSSTPDAVVSVMMPLPGVFRLQPNEIMHLRVLYANDPLPGDRESVFWLNLYEIPLLNSDRHAEQARLLVGINTQIKIFYRPKNLPSSSGDVGRQLAFRLEKTGDGWVLVCYNRSPYFASFASLNMTVGDRHIETAQSPDMMTPPMSERRYSLSSPVSDVVAGGEVGYILIDDSGNFQQGSAALPR
ncbi:MAG: molecular chaperone [Herbaspirillum sp.]